MIVGRVMTKNPVFVHPDTSVNDARSIMAKEKVARLPVLDHGNRLVGILTKHDLFKASPSPATGLDMYEISYLLSKLKVEQIMERNVVTVSEGEVVEEAARIMADRDISCLPVLRDKLLVGIITNTDLLRVFVNAFGVRHPGVRAVLNLTDTRGEIARVTRAVADEGGNIESFIVTEGDDLAHRRGTIKITGISSAAVDGLLKGLGVEVEDIRSPDSGQEQAVTRAH
jgi:acetoin utilization protein AcuB